MVEIQPPLEEVPVKLYYAPGTCALAPHIALAEAGIQYTLEKTDIRAKTYSGGDFRKVNPKGSVPVIENNSGEILTENAVILQYIGDLKPDSGLVPKVGTWERVRMQETLNFITTEIHKSYGVLFGAERMVQNPEGLAQLKSATRETISAKYGILSDRMAKQDFAFGPKFTAADCYLYTVTRWAGFLEVDLSRHVWLPGYLKRIADRASVQKALAEEGLKP